MKVQTVLFLSKKALNKVNVKNYSYRNICHYFIYETNRRENVYICKIVNYIMSVN